MASGACEGSVLDVERGEMIGQGNYGRVYKGRWRSKGVAIKEMEFVPRTKKKEKERKSWLDDVRTEVDIMKYILLYSC